MSTTAPIPELRSQENPPFYRDIRVIRWIGQIAVVVVVVLVARYLYGNIIENLESAGLPTGFSFLDGKFGSAIPGLDDAADESVRGAFWLGYLNTLRVIVVGIPFCTLIGVLIGIARLSDNAAARTFGTLYVETFRNIPALVWIFITHFAITLVGLPAITEANTPLDVFVVSNRGIGIPWLNPDASTLMFVGFIGIGLLAAVLISAYRGQVNAKTGAPARGGLYGSIGFIIVLLIGNVVAGNALALDPAFVDGRQIGGGLDINPAYASLTIALTLYTASHVAEIVRGAIQAIHKGQTEAAQAIALTGFQRYRFVILPQAFRIMIPPLANQYLNITKNSSLAVAIGYIEITAIFQRATNNAAPAIQTVVVLMGLYLTFSLSISAVANFFNRRLALETR
ncbi:amino acid ABC transporter permease [Euzebya tangerina]|uniref:amino acid ABC transporter permease n=1 Tax=Euzebya tangerina TaxID=591198 RepID=UPI000E318D59|nr:ABC transporter permease subunit [Euzebya tangerina]